MNPLTIRSGRQSATSALGGKEDPQCGGAVRARREAPDHKENECDRKGRHDRVRPPERNLRQHEEKIHGEPAGDGEHRARCIRPAPEEPEHEGQQEGELEPPEGRHIDPGL